MVKSVPYNEVELIKLLKIKDPGIFSFLYDKYAAILYGVILKRIGDRVTAEEILKNSFSAFCDEIDSYRIINGNLLTWMIAVTRSQIDHYLQKDKKVKLNDLINISLPHQDNILELIYLGYTKEDIAIEMNLSLATIKNLIRSAILRLRNQELVKISA